MDAGMTLAALLALILSLGAGTGDDAARKNKLREAQQQFENQVKDHTVTASDLQSVRGSNLNHNETLKRDSSSTESVHKRAGWLSDGPVNIAVRARPLSTSQIGGSCPQWACGSNHNETLVRDAKPNETAAVWSSLFGDKTFTFALFLKEAVHFGGCPPTECGANHNETLVRDVSAEPADRWPKWRAGGQSFSTSEVMLWFAIFTVRVKCEDYVCGANHNETLVRDARPAEPAGWSSWLFADQTSNFTSFVTKAVGFSGCPVTECGANHNETLVSDVRPAEPADRWPKWLTGGQSFATSDVMLWFSIFTVRVRCDEYVCGINHSETLLRDAR